MAQQFLSAPVWKDYVLGASNGLENVTTEADVNKYILSTSASTLHMVGTAAMSAPDAGFGVVNPDLRLKGATGLRIVDTSVYPFVPSSHPQAPTYIFAERAADLIKASWS